MSRSGSNADANGPVARRATRIAASMAVLLLGSITCLCCNSLKPSRFSSLPFALDDSGAQQFIGAGVEKWEPILQPPKALHMFKVDKFTPVPATGTYTAIDESNIKSNLRLTLGEQVAQACKGAIGLNGDVTIVDANDISIEWINAIIPNACAWTNLAECCPAVAGAAPSSTQYGACGDHIITAVYKTKLTAKANASTTIGAGASVKCQSAGGAIDIKYIDSTTISVVSEGWNVGSSQELHEACSSIALKGQSCSASPPVEPWDKKCAMTDPEGKFYPPRLFSQCDKYFYSRTQRESMRDKCDDQVDKWGDWIDRLERDPALFEPCWMIRTQNCSDLSTCKILNHYDAEAYPSLADSAGKTCEEALDDHIRGVPNGNNGNPLHPNDKKAVMLYYARVGKPCATAK